MQLSHYFLRNAALVGGVYIAEIYVSEFSQIMAFDSGRQTACLLQKCKIMYENIAVSFYKQN